MRPLVLALTACLILTSGKVAAQTTYYVNNLTGSDTNSGLTGSAAKSSLSAAIASASSGDTISVAATGQRYGWISVVDKILHFVSTGGRSEFQRLWVNLTGLSSNKVFFHGPFLVHEVDLSAGTVEGPDSLTVAPLGRVTRRSQKGVVGQQLQYGGSPTLQYTGSESIPMGLETPPEGTPIDVLEIALHGAGVPLTLSMNRNLTVRQINFIEGLLKTGDYILTVDNPVGTSEQGFTRNTMAGYTGHVVGKVRKTLKVGTRIAFGRNEFPVGDSVNYRPLTVTLVDPDSNYSLGVNLTASEYNFRPRGIAGLPIYDGIEYGRAISRFPGFHWGLDADSSLAQRKFGMNLELTAEGFTQFNDVSEVRIIYRAGSSNDSTSTWRLTGAQYDNYVISGIPTVVNVNTPLEIPRGQMILTYGLGFYYPPPISDVFLSESNPIYRRDLKNPAVFTGARGTIKHEVSISDTAIASAVISGDTLIITRGKKIGVTSCRLVGIDTYDGSRISVTFSVTNQSATQVVPETESHPFSFRLECNYPNPFNATTVIQFDLPEATAVRLQIFNTLGEKVDDLVNDHLSPGSDKVKWNAGAFPSGVYFYRLQAGDFVDTKKLILLK